MGLIITLLMDRLSSLRHRLAHGDAFRDKFLDSSVDSWITADLNYTYSMGELKFINDASITLGIQNITDEEPPFVPVITGYDGHLA